MKTKALALSLLAVFLLSGCSLIKSKTAKVVLQPEEAKAKAEEFINNNLMKPGSKATIKEITEDGDLYKLVVDVGGQNVDSFISKDGKNFFPQVMNIEEVVKENTESASGETAETAQAPKADKPKVELFVMSHCPYGTQIEKGILPVVEALKGKIDFELEFVDYAMHDKKEIDEQLNQYCIQKENQTTLLSYLKCFLEAGDGAGCLDKTGIDKTKLASCAKATDEQFKITEKYNDKSTWSGGRFPTFDVNKDKNEEYGISGSPGLVINGALISANRDSASLLKAICASFNSQPEECSISLSSTPPSAGFGFGASGTDDSASCN